MLHTTNHLSLDSRSSVLQIYTNSDYPSVFQLPHSQLFVFGRHTSMLLLILNSPASFAYLHAIRTQTTVQGASITVTRFDIWTMKDWGYGPCLSALSSKMRDLPKVTIKIWGIRCALVQSSDSGFQAPNVRRTWLKELLLALWRTYYEGADDLSSSNSGAEAAPQKSMC